MGFYVTTTGSGTILYTNGSTQGALAAQNAELQIFEGHGGFYPFNVNSNPRIFNGRINYQPLPINDLAVISIDSPQTPTTDCDLLGSAESVTAKFSNFGVLPIFPGTAIPVSLFLDGVLVSNETLTIGTALLSGNSVTHTFAATVNLAAAGTHVISVSHAWPSDLLASNNILGSSVTTSNFGALVLFPHSESFDGFGATNGGTAAPVGWIQDPSDGGGLGIAPEWQTFSVAAPNNGPPSDHTTGSGFYFLAEDSGSHHSSINLKTPCLQLNGLSNPRISFFVYSDNSSPAPGQDNALHVDVITYPGGILVPDVVAPIGALGPGWQLRAVNLSSFVGMIVQVQFRATTDGGGDNHSLAIDDITIQDITLGAGQAPQPGLAVLDINEAIDANGFKVEFGDPGPYFAEATVGDFISFDFEAAPVMPIVLLSGPRSAALANFTGIGSVDIGTGIDAMTGMPTGITVLADGSQPSFPNVFFVIQNNGTLHLNFPVPMLPLGVFTTFQAAIFNGGTSILSLSNAVEVSILP